MIKLLLVGLLEDVDDENGCIHYVKGSHKYEGYRPHGKSEILGFSKGVTDFGTEEDKKYCKV